MLVKSKERKTQHRRACDEAETTHETPKLCCVGTSTTNLLSARFIGPMARLWVPTESSKVEVGTPVRREQKVFSGASNSLTAREQRRRKHQLLAPMDVKPRSLAHDLEHAALLLARPGSPERGLRFRVWSGGASKREPPQPRHDRDGLAHVVTATPVAARAQH